MLQWFLTVKLWTVGQVDKWTKMKLCVILMLTPPTIVGQFSNIFDTNILLKNLSGFMFRFFWLNISIK